MCREENLQRYCPAENEYSGAVKDGSGALITQFSGRLLIPEMNL